MEERSLLRSRMQSLRSALRRCASAVIPKSFARELTSKNAAMRGKHPGLRRTGQENICGMRAATCILHHAEASRGRGTQVDLHLAQCAGFIDATHGARVRFRAHPFLGYREASCSPARPSTRHSLRFTRISLVRHPELLRDYRPVRGPDPLRRQKKPGSPSATSNRVSSTSIGK